MNTKNNSESNLPELNIRTPIDQRSDRVMGYRAADLIVSEMRALGISKARLVRHARRWGITESRTNEVLAGGGTWNRLTLDNWLAIVQTAWVS